MVPSDQYVRFYNEVFKYIDTRGEGELEKYFDAISRNIERRCLKQFTEFGLEGVYQYYQVIKEEENCGLTMVRIPHGLRKEMRACPSLGKVLDNDATPCPRYCEHCPGWLLPLISKAGLWIIFDLGDCSKPSCRSWIFDDMEAALEQKRILISEGSNIKANF